MFLFNVNVSNPTNLNDTISYGLTKLAIDYGADVNYYNEQTENTSLMYSINHNRVDNAKLLIDCGADFLEFKNKDGKNAFDLAIEKDLTQIVELMESKMNN